MKGIRLGLSLLLALFAVACGNGGSVKSPDFEPVLQSITITPSAAQSVGAGETVQYTATGKYSAPPDQGDGAERDITTAVTWTSSTTGVATIGEHTGLATGGSTVGTTTITATLDGKSAEVTLSSQGRVLRSIVVTPPNGAVPPNGSIAYTAQGIYSDSGTPQTIDNAIINWALADPALGTIAPATGQTVTVTANAKTGQTTLTASVTVNGTPLKGTALFGVGVLSSVAITPTTDSKPVGLVSTTFTAKGTYLMQDGSTFTQDVAASWAAANAAGTTGASPSLDTICAGKSSSTCKVTGHVVGKVDITATVTGVATPGTATLTVTDPVLIGVQITPDAPDSSSFTTPDTADLPKGASRLYYPLYYYSDDPGAPVTAPRSAADKVVWSSGNTAVVTATTATDNSVKATAVALGTANLVAKVGDTISDQVAITVGAATVSQLLSVRPAKAYVSVGRQVEFVAVGQFSDGSTADVADGLVTWSSADTSIATIDATSGVATGVKIDADGVTITATLNSDTTKTATAVLVVSAEYCTTPLFEAEGATSVPSPDAAGVCLLCGVANADYVVNSNVTDAATITVGVGALNAWRGIDVTASANAPSYTVPFPAGSRPSFVISNPNGPLVLAEVLSQIEITTLLGGTPQESSGTLTPLRLDLLGLGLIDNKTQGLVSFPTSLPYDGIRIKLKSGLATALSTMNVYQACATTTLPARAGSGISSLEAAGVAGTTVPTIEAGASITYVAHDYSTPDTELNPDDVAWTSSDTSVATVNAAGVVTGVGAGTATITGTLKDTSACGAHCSAIRDIKVVAALCEIPFEASQGATIDSVISGGLCLFCSTTDLGNVIDSIPTTYGQVYVPLALGVTATVTATATTPYMAGATAGFVVGSPNGLVATADLGSQIVIQTLLKGTPTGDVSTSVTTPLRLDLLGASLVGSIGANAQPLYITTTKNFDAVQITFKKGVSALESYKLYTACAKGPQ
ncbi:Ig-like domain-containing protein [Solimonas soli]|uniref:Ig-like domain-containing protein n=1 Tax=Solimonas soli TaxID=413479 RepID=UPI0004B4C65C|nr:Ig-like domain-containing protein [Solimonas soli]